MDTNTRIDQIISAVIYMGFALLVLILLMTIIDIVKHRIDRKYIDDQLKSLKAPNIGSDSDIDARTKLANYQVDAITRSREKIKFIRELVLIRTDISVRSEIDSLGELKCLTEERTKRITDDIAQSVKIALIDETFFSADDILNEDFYDILIVDLTIQSVKDAINEMVEIRIGYK